jgi:hypothetical protein
MSRIRSNALAAPLETETVARAVVEGITRISEVQAVGVDISGDDVSVYTFVERIIQDFGRLHFDFNVIAYGTSVPAEPPSPVAYYWTRTA